MNSLRDIINQVEQDANRLMAYDGELLGYFIPIAKWREIRVLLEEKDRDVQSLWEQWEWEYGERVKRLESQIEALGGST